MIKIKNNALPINGILLLDKPINITSNLALQKVKRLFNAKKAGHTGSLDPLATGMLPICFGEATKFSQFLLASDKSYRVQAKLGIETKTGDAQGEVTAIKKVVGVSASVIDRMMQKFLGEINQTPPMYSALKFEGKPLYEYARRGIEVERTVRRVKIFSLQLESFDQDQDQFTFSVKCSKGTYVRSLVEEMGRELGYGAHVSGLHRLTVSPYNASYMLSFSELEDVMQNVGKEKLLNCLLPIESAVESFPAIKLSTHTAFYLRNGQSVRIANVPDVSARDVSNDIFCAHANNESGRHVSQNTSSLVRLLLADGKFLGMGELIPHGMVKPIRLIAER